MLWTVGNVYQKKFLKQKTTIKSCAVGSGVVRWDSQKQNMLHEDVEDNKQINLFFSVRFSEQRKDK